ncbi:hypothetical protein DWZ46_08495 [Faecalibacterium prausnitzii]|uniref:PTS EIIB type-4 domain-containing protein n=1 Tax=Faecalibacterium prausnitzii TaxID=853 RepID=A0A3E2U4I1_9FIRM|nr:PTS sugar transporter subunit IIB [Faecalibacterium prausnitzii]RGB91116.1 hypothetical protein DWZ46_08495 [Faecalibacterium prausnitzii]
MIKLVRLDYRLLHGQVVFSWTGHVGAQRIIVVDDDAANDEMKKSALLLSKPAGVRVNIFTVDKAIAKMPKVEQLDEKIMMIFGNTAALLKFCQAYSTSICLMMEMQWVNSGSFHSGEFFHGPFEIVDKDVPFILLMNDGKTRPVDARALTFLHRFDALTTVVDAKDYGLGNAVDSSVITYFNPLMHTAVFRVYAEELSYVRQHPLTLRRYMWKLEY